MSFWKKLGLTIAGVAAYAGRAMIVSRIARGMQYATDEWVTYGGGAILTIVLAVITNGVFVYFGAHGMQTMLALLLVPVSAYFLFAPKIATPLVALTTANRAAAPGDQVNFWLVRDGIADLAKMWGIGVFWTLVYVVITMVAPFDLYIEFYAFLHIILFMVLATLVTGKVKVSPELYNRAFWTTLTLLIAGVLTVMIFREQLGPKWTEFRASQTARAEAEIVQQSIDAADKYAAEQLRGKVFVNKAGIPVVIINGQAVPAKDAIAAIKAQRNRTVREVTGKEEEDGAAQGGKSGSCGYFTWCFWGKASALLIAGHLLLLIPLIWGGKKLFGNSATTTSGNLGYTPINNPNITVISGKPGISWGWVLVIALVLGAAFYFYATQTADGYAITRRIVGSEDRVTQQDLRRQDTAKYVRARITTPDHPYRGKLLEVRVGPGILDRWEMNRMVRPDEDPTIIIAPNKNYYVLRQSGEDRAANLVSGNWVNTGSGESGDYTISPNPETGFLTATLAANGRKIEFEFKRFFQ